MKELISEYLAAGKTYDAAQNNLRVTFRLEQRLTELLVNGDKSKINWQYGGAP